MGGTCSAYVVEKRRWGNVKERDDLGDLGLDETIILRLMFRK